MRDEMRRVWYSRWFDMAEALVQDMRVGLALADARQGHGRHRRDHARARHRRQRRDLQRRPRRADASARQSRRRAADLHPPERARPRRQTASAFSVPEIKDIRERATTIEAFGEFSTVEFTLVGLGEPRVVQAGVVDGQYFDVMGLRPIIGRLIEPSDEGLNAAGVAVLTNRFWTHSLNSDPSVVGKTIQLGSAARR